MSPNLERAHIHQTTKLKLDFSRAQEIGAGWGSSACAGEQTSPSWVTGEHGWTRSSHLR